MKEYLYPAGALACGLVALISFVWMAFASPVAFILLAASVCGFIYLAFT